MRERMLAGEPYYASDPELGRMHARAQGLLNDLNASPFGEAEQRQAILADLFAAIGQGSDAKQPFYCDYGVHIFAGEQLFVNYDCVFLDCNVIRICDRVMMGPKVQIHTATHPLHPSDRAEGWERAYPITIGDDVWIGGGAIICPGVTIGAGSVVTQDVPPMVFAAGNPCRVIRELESVERAGQYSPLQTGS